MCLKHKSEFLASGLDLGLSEMVETRGHAKFGQLNAAQMAENESKRNVKRIENRKAKDSKRELVLCNIARETINRPRPPKTG